MYKWSLLLLATAAVFQPIASFTERNFVDGRQQCCDYQPHLLHRDTRLAVYENYRLNKVAFDDRRLNQRNVPATRRYEVRSIETSPARETESPAFRRVNTDRSIRLSRFDRRAVLGDSRDQRSRRVSQDRFSWDPRQKGRDYRDSQIRLSRDDKARVGNDQRKRSQLSMDSRREQRLLTRETTNMRDNRAFSEERDILQRTRNDVVRASIRNMRISRETELLNRRNYVLPSESKRQNVKENNRERRSLERRVRDLSESRLSIARSRSVDENRRLTRDNRMREVDLNRRVVKKSFNERRVRQTPKSGRITDSRRTRNLNERDQTREDFSQERRVARTDRRFVNTVEREVQMRSRLESTERSEERQSRRIRENKREYLNDARRNTDVNRRLVRSADRSTDLGRRQLAQSLDRRPDMTFTNSESRKSLLSRDKSRNTMIRNDNRRIENTRDIVRDTREIERQSLDHQMRTGRRYTPTNNDIRSSSEDRVMSRRTSRDADVRSRNMERRMDSVAENNRRFNHQSARTDVRSDSRNHEQQRQDNRRTGDRRMERSRHESRLVEYERSESRNQRFENRADTRNQRSLNRINERSEVLLRQSRALERDASRNRIARIGRDRIQNTRDMRNREIENSFADFDTRERRSEGRFRLALTEAAKFRREFTSKKSMDEQKSFALNWQYLFYTLQGIYLCGIIATMMKEKPVSHKSRSWWGISTKAVKVD